MARNMTSWRKKVPEVDEIPPGVTIRRSSFQRLSKIEVMFEVSFKIAQVIMLKKPDNSA